MEPSEILDHVRQLIADHSAGDPDKWFYANRFVFARLQLDERKTKSGVKKRLFAAKAACYRCSQPFEVKKGVNLHRLDQSRGYYDGNCVLMHPHCHEEHHAENAARESATDTEVIPPANGSKGTLVKKSKVYDDAPFTYWWDIVPNFTNKLDQYEAVEFFCKDTQLRCRVSIEELKPFLTEDRQTSRGDGNWGIKVNNGHEDELAFEPAPGGKTKWEYLPVTWT
ncbi:MAG: hypothetical protein HN350_15400 [Phycisphaerales bacterium]|nr:hypothetical protein [Phycisphaerales bacterium]